MHCGLGKAGICALVENKSDALFLGRTGARAGHDIAIKERLQVRTVKILVGKGLVTKIRQGGITRNGR
ncbi:hypothetical protein AB9K35_24340 [Leisingera sp. XS_AS12]|uniref:hypothetical protein n=1 Tax=Leisingera sp. XS_AS12 TaxID=3241294 RepID=UPI0035191735